MKTLAIGMLGVLGLAPAVLAQERQPDVLFISGVSHVGAGVTGGTGEIEWLTAASPRSTVSVGGAATSLSDLWWTYGTLGGSTTRRAATYSGRMSLGGGQWGSTRFPYQRYLGQATMSVAGPLYVDAEAQHIAMAGTSATIFRVGATYNPSVGVGIGFAYYAAPWDPTHDRAVSVRANVDISRVTMMGGVVATSRETAGSHAAALSLNTRIAREYFVGCTVPVGVSSVILSTQIAPQARGQIVRLLMTLRHPLGRRTHGSKED